MKKNQLLNGFSLMEMMVVLLIVSVIAAASAPMINKKMTSGAGGTGSFNCYWTQIGGIGSNSIAFNTKNEDNVAVIGDKTLPSTKPRLYINSKDKPQISFGYGNTAVVANLKAMVNSIALTNKNTESLPIGSTVLGFNAESGGAGSTAIGYNAITKEGANYSIAIGYLANVAKNAEFGVAIGRKAIANSKNSTAIGKDALAAGENSTAIGAGAVATNANTIVLGTVNDTVVIPGKLIVKSGAFIDGEIPESNSMSLVVGNGLITGGNSYVAGNFGVEGQTELDGQTRISGKAYMHDGVNMKLNDTTNYPIPISVDSQTGYLVYGLRLSGERPLSSTNPSTDDNGEVEINGNDDNNDNNDDNNDNTGNTGNSGGNSVDNGDEDWRNAMPPFGTETNPTDAFASLRSEIPGTNPMYPGLDYDSTIQIDYCDRRLKNVGEVFNGGLDEIRKLELFNYTYKKDTTKTPHVGVMAQDLQKIFPNAVTKGTDGFLRIRTEEMFYAMINAIKELANKFDLTDRKIAQLDKQNQEIIKQNAKLEKENEMIEDKLEDLDKRLKKLKQDRHNLVNEKSQN